MNKDLIRFTHLYVNGFGWENTILSPDDFTKVELIGENHIDGKIFQTNDDRILKGYIIS